MKKLTPLFARVLLERDKLKKVGSIIVPAGSQKRHAPCIGRAISKGPTADESIKVGGLYIFGQYAGSWLNSDGTPVTTEDSGEFYVCQDEDIICEVSDE